MTLLLLHAGFVQKCFSVFVFFYYNFFFKRGWLKEGGGQETNCGKRFHINCQKCVVACVKCVEMPSVD